MNPIEAQMATLLAPLQAEIFEFEDQSHLHIGHSGSKAGGHYAILIVSSSFQGMTRLARQRHIQTLLAPLFQNKTIHALSITAKSPQEYFH
ncbi:MAG: BolA family protein [Alysiella sp.]|uniref:BolA family protein n=1 Tax=Alysiella sp. TaxID=1872483 RepID=UPI0026DB58F3|nr:BolA family protein [Alysiella sp.]MDO4433284.1 BolA family protein [Alysiella sp.]